MRIKEILRTDSLAGSRIVINNNFKNTKAEVDQLNRYFDFEGVGLIYHDDEGENTPINYINSKEIITSKIQGDENFTVYKNDLPCIKFNENGNLLIRHGNKCDLDVDKEIENLKNNVVDEEGIANRVENHILTDDTFISGRGGLIDKIKENRRFLHYISDSLFDTPTFVLTLERFVRGIVEEYIHVDPGQCSSFSIYSIGDKLYIHCDDDSDRTNDKELTDYVEQEGDVLKFATENIRNVIRDYYGGDTGEEFCVRYRDLEHLETEDPDELPKINRDTEPGDPVVSYDQEGNPDYNIECEGYGTENVVYTITIL